MIKLLTHSVLALSTLGMMTIAMAAVPLANTTWQTYENNQPKAVVYITESGGKLQGKITHTKSGSHLNKTIIIGLKAEGGGQYGGGKITDPENGKTYRLTATLQNNTLNLKGHLGPFSRSQEWKKK